METPTRAELPEHAPSTDPVDGSDARGARRWPRRLIWILSALATLALVLGTLTVLAAVAVRSDLTKGGDELKDGKRSLATGDLGRATDAFRGAETTFTQAEAKASSGLSRFVRVVPILGRNLDVAAGTAIAGRELATAGAGLSAAVDSLPGGLGSLAPTDGRLPVVAIASLTDEVNAAGAHAEAALAAIDATPSTLLAGPVAAARVEAHQQVFDAATSLRSASQLLGAFPAFVGADGPRRYLLMAQSPAEQRGTGGIWGAFAVLTADDGAISVSPFHGVLTLPELKPDAVPAPNPDYRRNYDAYGGAGSFRDLNMTPDFPSAARAALGNYLVSTGEQLDGVISADPFALQELFKVTGPASIPLLGVTIDAANLIDFTTNEAYIRFAHQGKARKEVLGAVAGAAFEEFLTQPGEALPKLKAIGRAVANGNLKVYSTDPAFERGLRSAGRDGALFTEPGDDLLSVVVNNVAGSKIDYYVSRSVNYRIELGGDRQAFATTEVSLRNDAPATAIPGFVTDPATPGYHRGDAANLITVSCPGPCELTQAQRDGREKKLRVGSELGYAWYQDVMVVPSGSKGTLRMVTSRENAWRGNGTGGSYRLRILPQTTVRPTPIQVAIQAPAGTKIGWTSEPMEVAGSTAIWRGEPRGPVTLEVRFGAPIPLGWWRNLLRPLT